MYARYRAPPFHDADCDVLLTRRCLFRGVHEGGEYGSLIGADLMGELGVPLGGPDETFAE